MSMNKKPIQDSKPSVGRRDFLKGATGGAAALLATPAGQSALIKAAAGSAAALLASSAGEARANGVGVHTLGVHEVPSWNVAPRSGGTRICIQPGWRPADIARTHNSGEGGRFPRDYGPEQFERSDHRALPRRVFDAA